MVWCSRLMAQQITTGSGIEKTLVGSGISFTDGKCDGAVWKSSMNGLDQCLNAFICEIRIFTALEHKSAQP